MQPEESSKNTSLTMGLASRTTPDPNRDQPLEIENRIDMISDAFEAEYLRGARPDLGQYLQHCEIAHRSALFAELVPLDCEYRIRLGDDPTRAEYEARFPEFAGILRKIEFESEASAECTRGARDTGDDRFQKTPGRYPHFEFVEKLGKGSFGEVWKAKDARLRRFVAIKIPQGQSDAELHRFIREGRAAAQLRHPNIVAVHEVNEQAEGAYIVSEFIDGQTLRDWLAAHRPSPAEAAQLGAVLADALHHAHEHGVIHRDFKPGNVMMDRENQPHITDFGLAKWADDSLDMTEDGQVLGTPGFMSPEQARGESAGGDQRMDVYALGAVLYAVLTGNAPFQGGLGSILRAVVHEEPPPPHSICKRIPRDLETICLKALEKSPSKRYASAAEMAADLRRFLEGKSIQARRAGMLERSLRWIRRSPWIAAFLSLAMVTLMAFGFLFSLAQENRKLSGVKRVSLTTEPSGARAVFVPLSESTGEPRPEARIRARGRTPVELDLSPGEYLVVVALDDGRFHEVLRTVPEHEEAMPGPYDHLHWSVVAAGHVAMPSIEIPESVVTEEMALIEASSTDRDDSGRELARVESFYVDTNEWRADQPDDPLKQGQRLPEDAALPPRYDDAVRRAEERGKRLPTLAEYERLLELIAEGEQLPRPIYGLQSGLAEWTTSWTTSHAIEQDLSLLNPIASLRSYRVVLHGTPPPKGAKAIERPQFSLIRRASANPEVGFRCVRSAHPRYLD